MQGMHGKQGTYVACTEQVADTDLVFAYDFRLKPVFLVAFSVFVEFPQIVFVESYNRGPAVCAAKVVICFLFFTKKVNFWAEKLSPQATLAENAGAWGCARA